MSLVIRTHGDAMGLAALVRDRVFSVDRDQPIESLMTMEQCRLDSMLPARLNVFLSSAIALLALGLAAVGLYGVLAYWVARRTREIGIRMSPGAGARDVVGLVVATGLRPVLAGLAVGWVAGIGLTRFLGSVLFGVGALDTASFAGASLILALVAVLACYLPAARAAKVDPILALRHE